jgi:hypothetical protein
MKAILVDDVEQYKMLWDYGNDLKKQPICKTVGVALNYTSKL